MDNFSPLTTSSLNIHSLEIFTANYVVQGNATGPFRRASDLVNREDRDYIMLQEARITPIGRPPAQAPLPTQLMVARPHIHFVSLPPQPEPEHTTAGLGQYRDSAARKTPVPCCMMTDSYVITAQCYMQEGSTLENLLAMSDLFFSLTGATIHMNGVPSNPLQRELVIINKELIQAMYLMGAPTQTKRLDEPTDRASTSRLGGLNP
jgi:hypothetical protein